MKKTVSLLAASVLSISLLAGCGSGENAGGADNGKVKIEFFHYKREAMDTFDKLIEKFEKENPNIDIEQASPPECWNRY